MPTKSDRSSVYGLKFQARALAARVGETDKNQFLVGSLSLRHENELHLLEFNEEDFSIDRKIYRHPQEIWSISPCPSRPELVFTCYNEVTENGSELASSLFSMENSSFEEPNGDLQLKKLLTLGKHDGGVKDVLWNPSGDVDKIISIDGSNLRVWSTKQLTTAEAVSVIPIPPTEKRGTPRVSAASWSPHSTQQIGTANDCSIRGWDLRSLKQAFSIDYAHSIQVRDINYNPNRPNIIVSGGDDCAVRFWDTRNPKEPLKEIKHHTHWVWRTAFNRFHDQLVLTSGSDARVKLESVVSISSAAASATDERDNDEPSSRTEQAKDGIVATYDQHEESVYAIAWSAADPWIFASLSFDGRLVINLVPDNEKYKIIL